MPIFSLPSNSGIGTLGKGAYDFIRFLKKSGQKYWQILPICPPAKEDSPYLSYSACAGNPYFIDIDWLIGDGWISEEDKIKAGICESIIDIKAAKKYNSPFASGKINYDHVKKSRSVIFSALYKNFFNNIPDDYQEFCNLNKKWLDDYALFMTLLEYHDFGELHTWEDKYKYRYQDALDKFSTKHKNTLNYYKMLQYFFYTQWESLLKFAHKNDIKIIGDIPLYVALTSADAWVDPKIFNITDSFEISIYSGCPANKANRKDSVGQVWDSPVYNWDYQKKDGYSWWVKRLQAALKLYDIIRIDHFKGFESYYNIDAKTRDTVNGVWKKGPGYNFWEIVSEKLGYSSTSDLPIFAEDLGIITPPLKKLLSDCKFEGMKVLQYAFNNTKDEGIYKPENKNINDNKYLPNNYENNYVAYIGTHDNTSLLGWMDTVREDVLENALTYYEASNKMDLYNKMIHDIIFSKANTCILTVQDLLKLGHDSMINKPGTTGSNWKWQLTNEQFNNLDAESLLNLTKKSERI